MAVHPMLVELSFGGRSVPGWLPLLGAAAALVVTMVLGLRGGARRVAGVAGLAAAILLASAWVFRHGSLRVESLRVKAFGALLFAGLAGFWLLASRASRRAGLPEAATDRALASALGAGLVGARLGYGVLDAGSRGLSAAMAIDRGGLSAPFGVLAALLAAGVVLRHERVPFRRWADGCVVPLGWLVVCVAVGAYLSGSDYGVPLAPGAPAGLQRLGTFPRWELGAELSGPPVLLAQIEAGAVARDAATTLPVHPTQLYDLGVGLGLGALGLSLRRSQRSAGEVFLLSVVALGAARFVLEPLRGDADRGLADWHVASRPFLVGGLSLLLLIALERRARGPVHGRGFWTLVLLVLGALVAVVATVVLGRPGAPTLSPSLAQLLGLAAALASMAALARQGRGVRV